MKKILTGLLVFAVVLIVPVAFANAQTYQYDDMLTVFDRANGNHSVTKCMMPEDVRSDSLEYIRERLASSGSGIYRVDTPLQTERMPLSKQRPVERTEVYDLQKFEPISVEPDESCGRRSYCHLREGRDVRRLDLLGDDWSYKESYKEVDADLSEYGDLYITTGSTDFNADYEIYFQLTYGNNKDVTVKALDCFDKNGGFSPFCCRGTDHFVIPIVNAKGWFIKSIKVIFEKKPKPDESGWLAFSDSSWLAQDILLMKDGKNIIYQSFGDDSLDKKGTCVPCNGYCSGARNGGLCMSNNLDYATFEINEDTLFDKSFTEYYHRPVSGF